MPTKPLWDGLRSRSFSQLRSITHVKRLLKVIDAHLAAKDPAAIAALNSLIEDEVFQIRLEAKLEAGAVDEAERMLQDYLKTTKETP